MDDKSKLKLYIAGGIAGFILIGGISFFILKGNDKEASKQTIELTDSEENLNKEVTDKLNENIDKEEDKLPEEVGSKEELIDKIAIVYGENTAAFTNGYKLGSENNEEYPLNQTETLYNKVIHYAQTANYPEIIKVLDNEAKRYKFTEKENLKIGRVYKDAKYMLALDGMPSEGHSSVLKTIKDPLMKVTGLFMVSEKPRRDFIFDDQSLSPIVDGKISIISLKPMDKEKDKEMISEMSEYLVGDLEYMVAEIVVEDIPLKVYLGTSPIGTDIYSIRADEGVKHPFRTIAFWKSRMN